MPTAIVTGGAVRIGAALANRLAERNWNIALHYNSSEPYESKNRLEQSGVRVLTYQCDLRNLSAVREMMAAVCHDFDDVSLLVNCAANFIQENIEETRNETLMESLQVNLMAPYILMREYKRKINQGMIVNLLDERIEKNIPTFAAYSVSKVGLAHLTRLAAVEWGATVRVNGIAPGLILPPVGHGDEYLTKNAKLIPTKTHGSVKDITRGMDYLLDSPFVNGEILFIDGGSSQSR